MTGKEIDLHNVGRIFPSLSRVDLLTFAFVVDAPAKLTRLRGSSKKKLSSKRFHVFEISFFDELSILLQISPRVLVDLVASRGAA